MTGRRPALDVRDVFGVRGVRDVRGVLGGIAGAVTVAGMVATPLVTQGGAARRVLSSVVVTGLFSTTAATAARRWGVSPTAAAAAVTIGATTLVERLGTATGVPFGRYRYTGALRPEIGGVPAIVPLAWFAMAVPARATAHAALGDRSSTAGRVLLGGAALTAWDLFLDPQMVGEGYWRWARGGVYRGIPLTNYLGWFATGTVIMAVLDALLPASVPVDDAERAADGALVGEYAFMAVMETVGFAAFFRDRLVALAGGLAMLPVAGAAVARWRRG